MFLNSLESKHFHDALPQLPSGKYAHIILVRETTSFPLFQTDGELNTAYVKAGLAQRHQAVRARITMFKRKQTSAERLNGRELLRRYGIISENAQHKVEKGDPIAPYFCEYNSADFCKLCPDCIYYGFAIGGSGSERSKVLSDSAYSLTPFDSSHQTLTFNAPYENGTMSRGGETRSSIGEQDHVLPQVFFPSVITIRDPTEAEFLYVLNNILRTSRYGAQTTRTGTLENHLVGLVFADGEIFSNLKFAQAIYDQVGYEQDPDNPATEREVAQLGQPLETQKVLAAAREVVDQLLAKDGVSYTQVDQEAVKRELNELTRDPARLQALLEQAARETTAYANAYGFRSGKGKK